MRGAECIYRHDTPEATLPRISDETPATGSESPTSQDGIGSDPSSFSLTPSDAAQPLGSAQIPHAELARGYFDFAADTFSRYNLRSEQHWIWHVFIPSLAYSSPTVLHGMLALGAISLHFNNHKPDRWLQIPQQPQRAMSYFDAAVTHGEVFVKQSRLQLDKLDPADVDSNTACSRLLCVLSFSFFRHYREVGVDITDHQAWTWLRLLRGVQTVHTSLLRSDLKVDPMVKQDMMPELLFSGQQPAGPLPMFSGDTAYRLAFIRRTRLERFETLYKALTDGTLSLGKHDAALAVIDSLVRVTDHICEWDNMNSLFRALCTWPGELPEEFVQMLTQCHLSALVIHAHWLMLVVLAEDLWWVGDMARKGIRAVVEIIPKTDVKMHALLERPRQLLSLLPSIE